MSLEVLRSAARRYCERLTITNYEDIAAASKASPVIHAGSIDLVSLIEKLGLYRQNVERVQLFEQIFVLEKYFAVSSEETSGNLSDHESASKLCEWLVNAILPSKLFAERSPYFEVEDLTILTPDATVKEQTLGLYGLLLLSRLFKVVHLKQDDSSTNILMCLASFTDENEPWTSAKACEQATVLLKTYVDQAQLPILLRSLLQERVKPLFARSKNPAVTQQGRKAIDPLPAIESLHSDLDIESKPWKYQDVYVVSVFRWALLQLDEKSLEENWPLIIPPLLALIDDSSAKYKAKGCDLLRIFLEKCPPPLLQRTGLGEVFENAVMPCLMYLPSLTEEAESVQIISAAYPALIELSSVRFADDKDREARTKAWDKILRDGVLKGYAHAGEHVRLTEVMVRQMAALIDAIGIASVRHFKHILPLLSANLVAPFATAYPPLLQASIEAIQTAIIVGWPRISHRRAEILKGLSICWCRFKAEDNLTDELQSVQASLKRTSRLLTSLLRTEVDCSQEYQTLVDGDKRIEGLLLVGR